LTGSRASAVAALPPATAVVDDAAADTEVLGLATDADEDGDDDGADDDWAG
jgi:hypothetical protein